MIYGYIRVSTRCQAMDGNSIEAQKESLSLAGVSDFYIDTYSGGSIFRPQFEVLLSLVKEGDVIVVTKIDRFARTLMQANSIIEQLLNKGVSIHILNLGLLDNSSTSILIRNIMLAFAQFERDTILERTQEGKAIARQKPGFREGRPRKFNPEQIDLAIELLKTNSYKRVSLMTGISESTLVRAKREKNYKKPYEI